MSKILFDASDSEPEKETLNEIKTNQEYAKSYNKFKQKELLKKLKDRSLDERDSDLSESSSESDVSDENIYDPKFDEEFFKTLSSLKSKDPKIYDGNSKFFDNADSLGSGGSRKSGKALTLKDYERKIILEKGGVYEDENDGDENEKEGRLSPSYVREQEQLKNEFKKVLNNDDDEEEEFGAIFKKRNKTKEEEEKEEADFVQWLAGKKENIDESKKQTLDPLKQYWDNPTLSKEEKFLRDYVLNSGYVSKSLASIPTYEEVVNEEDLIEDEKELEKQSEFEKNYNFRFEETNKNFIKRYPRTIEDSVRRVDEKRKQKRLEVKERKKKEKEEKYKEIKVVKELKKKEIEEKIQKLKEVTGNNELPFNDIDLEEDFDPEVHDKRMTEVFSDEYYKIEEDEDKPECQDIEELKVEDWDNYDLRKDDDNDNYDPYCEDDDFIMDCDYEENSKGKLQKELIESTQGNKKHRRRRNRFMEVIKKEKPVFNPEDEKTFAEYIDEYYKLDFEDIIDDIPCRFKYVETVPNDYGLTIEEILLAKNKELNQWVSLKKAVQIRSQHVERNEVNIYKKKAQNLELKKKIFRSLYGSSSEDEEDNKNKAEKSGKNENEIKTEKSVMNENNEEKSSNQKTTTNNSAAKRKHDSNKLQSKQTKGNENKNLNDNTQNQSEIKRKKKSRKKNKNEDEVQVEESKFDVNKKHKNKIKQTKESIVSKKWNRNAENFIDESSKGKNSDISPLLRLSDERLRAYGLNPKKFNKKQKYLIKKQKLSSNKKLKYFFSKEKA